MTKASGRRRMLACTHRRTASERRDQPEVREPHGGVDIETLRLLTRKRRGLMRCTTRLTTVSVVRSTSISRIRCCESMWILRLGAGKEVFSRFPNGSRYMSSAQTKLH
jgi:hypothetical protein